MKMKASVIRAFTVVFIAATLIIEACSKKTEGTAPEVQKGETQIPSSTTGPVTLKVKADIYGRVFHMFTNKPLEDTTVIALGAEKVQTKTDSQGYFVLKGVPVLVSSVLVYSQAGSYVTSLTLAQSTYNIPVPIIFEHREKKEAALRIEEGNLDFVRTIQNVVVTVNFEKIVGQSIAYEVPPVNAGNIQMRPFVPSFKGKVLKKDGSGLKDATVMIADFAGAVPDAEFEFAITKTGEDGMFEFNLLHQIPSVNGLQLIVFPFSSTETQKITDYGITYEYDTAFDGAVNLAPSFAGVSNLIEIGADGKLVQTRLYVISLKDRASDLRLIWSSIRNGDTVYQDSISEILLLFNRPVDVSTLEIRLIYPTGIVVGVTGIDTTKNPLIKVTLPKLDPNPYILRIAARDASGGGTGPIPLSFIQIAFDVYNPNLPVLACITPSVHVGSGSVYKVDDDEIIYGPSNNIQAYKYPSTAVWINWLPNPDASGYRIYARDTKGFQGGTVEWQGILTAIINEGSIVKAKVDLTPFNKYQDSNSGPWLGGNEVKILVCPLNFNGVGANPKDFEAQALSLKDNIGPRVQTIPTNFNGVPYDSTFTVDYMEPLNFTEGVVVSRVSGYADVLSAVINDNIANQISITLTPRVKKKLAQDANRNDRIIVLDDVSDLFVGGRIKIDPQTPFEEVMIIQAIDLDTKTIVLNAGLTYSHSANAPVWFIGPSGAGTTKYVDSLQENISFTLQRIVIDNPVLSAGDELLIGDEVVEIAGFNGTYGIRLRDINNVVGSAILRAVYPSGTKVDRVFRQNSILYTSSATAPGVTLASTTLASPAVANTPTIKVTSLLNISTGDRIVIEGENAVFTVQSIDSASNTIVLNTNLSSSHPAGEKVYEVEADDPSAADSNDADAACNTTFSSSAAAGETKITLTDASDVQVGDFLLLRRAAAPNFEEIVKVVGVSGNTVSVSKPIFGNYNAGDSVREVVLVKDTRVNVKLLAAYPMIRVGNANQLKINGTVRIDDGTLTQDAVVKSIIDGALLGLGGSFISVVPSGNVFSKDFPFGSKVTSSDVREADILSVDVKDTSGNSSTTVDINSNGKPENKLRGDGQVVE
jgi:hypothetical protein